MSIWEIRWSNQFNSYSDWNKYTITNTKTDDKIKDDKIVKKNDKRVNKCQGLNVAHYVSVNQYQTEAVLRLTEVY